MHAPSQRIQLDSKFVAWLELDAKQGVSWRRVASPVRGSDLVHGPLGSTQRKHTREVASRHGRPSVVWSCRPQAFCKTSALPVVSALWRRRMWDCVDQRADPLSQWLSNVLDCLSIAFLEMQWYFVRQQESQPQGKTTATTEEGRRASSSVSIRHSNSNQSNGDERRSVSVRSERAMVDCGANQRQV